MKRRRESKTKRSASTETIKWIKERQQTMEEEKFENKRREIKREGCRLGR